MTDTQDNNKRIAKNTIALYFRTFITMLVGIYTGRVMLQALGIEDYGIQNVVGGIIGFSSLITGAMSDSIGRYLTFGLGRGNKEELKTTFSTGVSVMALLAFGCVLALEVAGVLFLNAGANIPDGRLNAANWVFQLSLISLFVSLISSPYNAIIVAHERMKIYAYTSIIESVLRLAICFIVIAFPGDKLIFYSFLQVLVVVGLQIFYSTYCGRNFYEAHYSPRLFDRSIFKEIAKYSGWNLLGNSTWVLNTQGINMLVNVFFGVAYNAARGVALTINGSIQKFVGSFMVAFTPQITKSYAANDYDYSFSLTNRGTKFSWFLMLIFIVPVFVEAETLLGIWLVEVPPMAVVFLRFALFESLAVRSGDILNVLIHATGNIKMFTIKTSLFGFLVFPLSWFAFKLGAPVWSTYAFFILIYFIMNFFRLSCLKSLVKFDVATFIKKILIPCCVITFLAFSAPMILSYCFEPSISRFFWMVPFAISWTLFVIYFMGLTNNEKVIVLKKTKHIIRGFIK